MSSTRILRAIKWLLYVTVVGTPLFYWKWSLFPYNVPKTAFFEALVEIIFALWLALAISDKRYRPRMTLFVWTVATFLGILTVMAFIGVDPWRSFFSDIERGFGIIAYFHFAALAFILSSLANDIPWKKIWYASFGTSLITVAIAAIQLSSPDFLLSGDLAAGRPGATFGNPTFLAGYLLLNVFVAGCYFFRNNDWREKLFLAAVIIFDVIGIFIAETRGDILGLFAGIFALVVAFAVRPPVATGFFSRRKLYALLVIVLLIVGSGVWFTRASSIWEHVPGLDRLKSLTISGANSDIGARLIATTAAWQGFLDRPLTGWGFENFNIVFNTHYDPKVLEYGYGESNFDKPHDILLEMLTSGGILLFAAYLVLLAAFGYEAWKLKDRIMGPFMIAFIVAYFVRSVVIFDTLGPVLVLYLALAWVDGRYWEAAQVEKQVLQNQAQKQPRQGVGLVRGGIMATTLIPAVIVAYVLNGAALAASVGAWEGHNELQVLNNPSAGVASFTNEVNQWNVYQWDFIRDYANTVAQAYFYNHANIPTTTIQDAIAKMNDVVNAHPNDAYNHYLLTDIYNLTYDIDPKNYLAQAEAQARQAIALSPNRQEIYYYLSKTKTLEGDDAGALAVAKKALDLDPNVADSHFYYGMLAFANGQNALGYQEVEKAIALGRQWQNFNEPRVAADYFADSGHLAEAIQLYQAALKLNPQDLESEIKLGAAYYLNKQPDLARQYLSDAASKFDFKSSPVYAQYKPILDALGIQ